MARSWLALAAMVVACGDPVGPNADEVMVSMVRQGAGETTVVAVTVENHGEAAIDNGCLGLYLERETPTGWELAIGPSCVQGPAIRLQPGDSRTISLGLPAAGHRYRPAAAFSFAGETLLHRVHGVAEQW